MPLRLGNQEVILRRGNLEVPALYRANFRAFSLFPPIPPIITQNPTGLTVTSGTTVTLSATASGYPAPTVKWQKSPHPDVNGGPQPSNYNINLLYKQAFSDIPGATSTTYSFTAEDTDLGYSYRAVFINGSGTAITQGAELVVIGDLAGTAYATGGTVTTFSVGGKTYRVHTFTDVGESNLNFTSVGGEVEYLVIGGGGGGGGGGVYAGSGGGAGGLLNGITTFPLGNTTVVVGSGGLGGASATNGNDSSLGDIVAFGGGRGGQDRSVTDFDLYDGGDGGSGGGATRSGSHTGSVGIGVSGQGNNGVISVVSNGFGGSGGGAGAIAWNLTSWRNSVAGIGKLTSIQGFVAAYASGGSGGETEGNMPIQTPGGGGKGVPNSRFYNGTAGTPNTGGGGGGGGDLGRPGKNGGSGVVIVRYAI